MKLAKLRQILENLEIDDLKHLLTQLGITIKSNEKYELMNQLTRDGIYQNKCDEILTWLDETSFTILDHVVENSYIVLKNNDPYTLYYQALSDIGLLFKIKENHSEYFIIADEIYEIISQKKSMLKAEIRNNDLILKFAKAAVSYYGLLDLEEIMELYSYYHRYSKVDIFPRLLYLGKVQSVFSFDGVYLYDNNVKDIENFVKDKAHFKSLSLYKYSMEQFYVDERYIAIDVDYDFYYEMEEYFTSYIKCDSSIIVAIYYFLMYEYDIQKLREAIDQETVIDASKLNIEFDKLIKQFYPSVRCWVLKGHMVKEVNEMIEENPQLYLNSKFVLLKNKSY